jgi:hypothetical protein
MQAKEKSASKPKAVQPVESDKNFAAALVVSILFGGFGADRFYLGYIPTGALKLLTGGGFGVWILIDLVRIGLGNLRDPQGRPLAGYAQNGELMRKIMLIYVAFVAISFLLSLLVATIVMTVAYNARFY